jgi:1-deoxy-D-xylulose-5-phosphate reductoisomerase
MDISKTIIDAYERFTDLPKCVDDVFAIDSEIRNKLGIKS